MAKKTEETCDVKCPIGALVDLLTGGSGVASKVMEHFNNARVEALLGIRELIDGRIAEIKKKKPKAGTRSRRIKVTEK